MAFQDIPNLTPFLSPRLMIKGKNIKYCTDFLKALVNKESTTFNKLAYSSIKEIMTSKADCINNRFMLVIYKKIIAALQRFVSSCLVQPFTHYSEIIYVLQSAQSNAAQ